MSRFKVFVILSVIIQTIFIKAGHVYHATAYYQNTYRADSNSSKKRTSFSEKSRRSFT